MAPNAKISRRREMLRKMKKIEEKRGEKIEEKKNKGQCDKIVLKH